MKETKKIKSLNTTELDQKKRSFMKKFGKYAALGVGATILMKPTDSSADNYGGGQSDEADF